MFYTHKTHKRRPGHRLQANNAALSLVEIVMALAIIAVLLSTASLTAYKAISSARLQQAADRISADLRQARANALRDRTAYSCLINTQSRRYLIGKSDEMGGGVLRLQAGRKHAYDNVVDLAGDPYRLDAMRCTGVPVGMHRIDFDAFGQVDPPGEIVLGQNGRTLNIVLTSQGHIESNP